MATVKEALDGPCVLVVDDEVGNRESMRMILEDGGYLVGSAENGIQAISQVQEKHYDLILMDVGMPGIDGFEACRKIVELDPTAKVIFITAHELGECSRQALMAGAFSLLCKPVEPEDMVNLIHSLVES